MKKSIIGLKDLRENIDTYIDQVNKGASFIVVRRSKAIFKLSPPEDDAGVWESVVDFTKMKKGGVAINDVLSRI